MSMKTRSLRRGVSAVAMAVAMVVGATGFAGTAHAGVIVPFPSHHVNYSIVNRHTGKCLEVYGISQADGADVVQWDCWNGPNQHWRLVPTDGIWHEIRNAHSNKCLEVYAHQNHIGADVVQWTCWGGWNQQWAVYSASGPWLILYPRHAIQDGSDRCASVSNFGTWNGADVVLEANCGFYTNRMWGFYTVP